MTFEQLEESIEDLAPFTATFRRDSKHGIPVA
jgi:hypothetical protein